MAKRTFTCTRKVMASHPELFTTALAQKIIEDRKGWSEFEVVFFDGSKELYRDVLKAESQENASDIALQFAQFRFPECNSIHVDPVAA